MFRLPDGPLLGLGEGGPQFDRKGSVDPMRSGQGGYRLATHGTRAPAQWLVGTDGWALFIHQPYGSFDFTGDAGRFSPRQDAPLPFVVYPGADGTSSLYEDDGRSFAYRRGDWMRLSLVWEDVARRLTIRLAPGSRMRAPMERRFDVRVAGSQARRSIAFRGDPVDVEFG